MFKIIIIILISVCLADASAQTLQSDIALMDFQRLAQLKNEDSLPKQSFVIRSTSQLWSEKLNDTFSKKSKPTFQWVQAGYTMQSNSSFSVGYNDGSLYPSVGMQQRFTVGAHLQWKGFSLLLQPELITAANKEPTSFKSDPSDGNYWSRYYLYVVNKIDDFNRFGTTPITKAFFGQSSLRYNTNYISAGISTENIWWGPGIRNSLVMTNNAPGFIHLTVNSRKPIPTKWGNIEFQAVLGQLKNAATESPDNAYMRTFYAGGIANKLPINRGIFGYIFSWNPTWTPNLHIGIAGASYFYVGETQIEPTILVVDAENKKGSASLGSLFFRYAMPKENAEVYVEYGRANRLATPFNMFGDTIPAGFTAGFRKLFINHHNSKNDKGGILLSFELTQLQLPDARLIFNQANVYSIPKTNSWYTNAFVKQGYTNEGQVMGASIGPGSNSETLNISWVKGLKRIGITAERISHNNDFYVYNYFSGIIGSGYANKYWVDLNVGLQFQWDYKQLLFSGFFNYTSALNYRWVKLDGGYAGPSPLSDRTNNQISLSMTYFFKNVQNKF